jgi:uncharacterized membrane protein
VQFKPAVNGGTEIHVILQYDPPAGRVGRALARLLGDDPSRQIRQDLNRFKQSLESGLAGVDQPVVEDPVPRVLGTRELDALK